ncbi:translocon-associated protein subunit alpha isoform X1 [Lampetra fluviatilis]
MFHGVSRLLVVLLLAMPLAVLLNGKGPAFARADEDATDDEVDAAVEEDEEEDEEDDAEVEDEEPQTAMTGEDAEEEEEGGTGEPTASPHAHTTILFVKGDDFPANRVVKFLVGFSNNGSEEFVVESLDASFRYPQDFQFYIQNFTALQLDTLVKPHHQATFEYSFIPAEPMGGRPFGLVISLGYRDATAQYRDAVFNQTVTVTEPDEGIDGETFFMYMFLAGLVVLLLVGAHQLLESRKRKRPGAKPVEMGTSNPNGVDMSWIPQETLNHMKLSRRDKASPKRSPRKRVTRRSEGVSE